MFERRNDWYSSGNKTKMKFHSRSGGKENIMSTTTRQFIEKLLQAKNQGVYAEECAGMISDWYGQIEPAVGISLADMAYIVGSNEEAAAAWNKHEEGLADYFAEAVRLSNLTTTMHSLRQI